METQIHDDLTQTRAILYVSVPHGNRSECIGQQTRHLPERRLASGNWLSNCSRPTESSDRPSWMILTVLTGNARSEITGGVRPCMFCQWGLERLSGHRGVSSECQAEPATYKIVTSPFFPHLAKQLRGFWLARDSTGVTRRRIVSCDSVLLWHEAPPLERKGIVVTVLIRALRQLDLVPGHSAIGN